MRHYIFLCCLLPLFVQAQQVTEWTYDAWEKRVQNGKDTTYIVNFWATWCRPCVAELPYFEQLKAATKGEKVCIVLMSVDFPKEKESRLMPFLQARNLSNEVGLWMEMNENEWINRVDSSWSGALPGTWVWNASKNYRVFYERDFHDVAEMKSLFLKQ